MRPLAVILFFFCVSSGCGDRQRSTFAPEKASGPAGPASSPTDDSSTTSNRRPATANASANKTETQADDSKVASRVLETIPRIADAVTPLPSELPELVTLTEAAAKVVRAMFKGRNLDESIYLRIIAKRNGTSGINYDLNFTKKVDPATDVFGQTKGIRVAVNRSMLAFVRGGAIDFRTDSGFQFRKPDVAERDAHHADQISAGTRPNRSPAQASRPAAAEGKLGHAYGASIDPLSLSEPYNNIHPKDYVGPHTCAECHAEQYNLWRTHPHSKMNLSATVDTVVADFSGTELHYADGSVVFEENDGQFYMAMYRDDDFVRTYRVTRTVGSRIFQMYIGVQSEGPEAADDSIYFEERKLPFAYLIERKQWFPETYDEPVAAPEYDSNGRLTKSYGFYGRNFRPLWRESCIWCHNTYPYEARLQKRLVGFPANDLVLKRITHPVPLGSRANSLSLPPSDLVTLGISCESCHFGGREHAIEKREIRFVPSSEDLHFPKATAALVTTARERPYVVNAICAQCHAVKHLTYPNGASAWNSSEALDMQRGSCSSAIRCIDCHNPHQPGPSMSGGPDREQHIDACLNCHEKYRAPEAAAAHSRHPSSGQVSCLDCHMPRIVHGLHGITRTHRISSPTDPRMLSKGAPNACNICHLDRSIRWTTRELETGWGRKLEPSDSWQKWYGGSLEIPTGMAWLGHQAPMARQAAADAYSRSPLGQAALPSILPLLNDDNPATRMFTLFSVERILSRQLELKEYSPWSHPEERTEQVRGLASEIKLEQR